MRKLIRNVLKSQRTLGHSSWYLVGDRVEMRSFDDRLLAARLSLALRGRKLGRLRLAESSVIPLLHDVLLERHHVSLFDKHERAAVFDESFRAKEQVPQILFRTAGIVLEAAVFADPDAQIDGKRLVLEAGQAHLATAARQYRPQVGDSHFCPLNQNPVLSSNSG